MLQDHSKSVFKSVKKVREYSSGAVEHHISGFKTMKQLYDQGFLRHFKVRRGRLSTRRIPHGRTDRRTDLGQTIFKAMSQTKRLYFLYGFMQAFLQEMSTLLHVRFIELLNEIKMNLQDYLR